MAPESESKWGEGIYAESYWVSAMTTTENPFSLS